MAKMNPDWKKFKELELNNTLIGLWKGFKFPDLYWTPPGATVIAWNRSLHYCFIAGFDDTVFCVNPDNEIDKQIYPVARSFTDFLRLILATGTADLIYPAINMTREEFEAALKDPKAEEARNEPETLKVLNGIREAFNLQQMENPYGYLETLQSGFAYETLPLSPAHRASIENNKQN